MLTPSSVIQRREPFTSGPNNSVAMISATEIANTISALRRICRGDRNDTAIITMNDGSRNMHVAVEEVERVEPDPGRHRRRRRQRQDHPASISTMIAASSSRSTVHHHSLTGVCCSREIIGGPWAAIRGQSDTHWCAIVVASGLMEKK